MCVQLGLAAIALTTLVIVASSNAVNLTDGLDGLAGGCLLIAFATLGVICHLAGSVEFATQWQLPFVPSGGEMAVLAGISCGTLAGFLWFNWHPARVFMGNTGALPLGGLLGYLAVVCRQEILLIIVGAVFAAEAASVILQVASYRLRGRRIFLCAPLHHHFQFQGVPEPKIVARFWVAGALVAAIALGVIGLNARWLSRGTTPISQIDRSLLTSAAE